jgi:PqqA peptide cyclase
MNCERFPTSEPPRPLGRSTRPLALLAELTYRCPLHCPYCSNPVELARYRGELDTATWMRVLEEAAGLGIVQAFFSGGEPLVRTDLEELISQADRLGLYPFLSTSAIPCSRDRLASLQAAGLRAIQISLLDANAEANDRLAGHASFAAKHAAVTMAKELGFHVTLNVVLHRLNIGALRQLISRAVEWNVDKLELAHTQYTGWAFINRLALLPTREQIECAARDIEDARANLQRRLEIVHVLPDLYGEYPKACLHGWGRAFLTVAPDGVALPCQSSREIPGLKFPNVRDQSLEEIWFRSDVFQKYRGTDWMPEPCRSCSRREIDFGGCRCQAFLLAGDAGATDPVCPLSPRHAVVAQLQEEAATAASPLQYRRIHALAES